MRSKLPIILGYLALLLIALPVPLLHHYRTDAAIERMRPAVRLGNGTYSPMLMPSQLLMLRWLGSLSQMMPVLVLTAVLLSFWSEVFRRPGTLLAVAICQCAFTTIYAAYAALVLGLEWALRAA